MFLAMKSNTKPNSEKFEGYDEILGAKKFLGQIDGAEFKLLGLEARFGRDSELDRRNQISNSNWPKTIILISKIWSWDPNSPHLQNSKFLIDQNFLEIRLHIINFHAQNQKK